MDPEPNNNSQNKLEDNKSFDSNLQSANVSSPIYSEVSTQNINYQESNTKDKPFEPVNVDIRSKNAKKGMRAINFTALLAVVGLGISLIGPVFSEFYSDFFGPYFGVFFYLLVIPAVFISYILVSKAIIAINKTMGLINLFSIGIVALIMLVGFTIDNYGLVNMLSSISTFIVAIFVINLIVCLIAITVYVTKYLHSIKLSAKKQIFFGVVAILGTLISFGAGGLLLVLLLQTRACELSGSSKCL